MTIDLVGAEVSPRKIPWLNVTVDGQFVDEELAYTVLQPSSVLPDVRPVRQRADADRAVYRGEGVNPLLRYTVVYAADVDPGGHFEIRLGDGAIRLRYSCAYDALAEEIAAVEPDVPIVRCNVVRSAEPSRLEPGYGLRVPAARKLLARYCPEWEVTDAGELHSVA